MVTMMMMKVVLILGQPNSFLKKNILAETGTMFLKNILY